MEINTGREKEEEINEEVGEGVVKKVPEYKYLGLWINEKGNCMLSIERNMEKLQGKINLIINVASQYIIGTSKVRVKMYESCIVPSLLSNLEGWYRLLTREIQKLELQASSLTKL